MKNEDCDFVVVGHSIAGLAAALALSEAGGRTVLLDFDRDTDSIADLPRVETTSGNLFDERMRTSLLRAGVERDTVSHVVAIHPGLVVCADRQWTCRGVIFAPNGTEPGLTLDGAEALMGFGVSYSAASDAPLLAGRRMAVYGDSPRAIEHATVAARYASHLTVLLKGGEANADAQLLEPLRASSSVTIQPNAVLTAVHAGGEGMLQAIDVSSHRLETEALFVAQHPVADLAIVHGGASLAGLAAGIDYWDHAALARDGTRAARALLEQRSP